MEPGRAALARCFRLGLLCTALFHFTHSLENGKSTRKSTVLPKNYNIISQTYFCFRVSTPPVPGLAPTPGDHWSSVFDIPLPFAKKTIFHI